MQKDVKEQIVLNGHQSADMMLMALALAASHHQLKEPEETIKAVADAIKNDWAEKLGQSNTFSPEQYEAMGTTEDGLAEVLLNAFNDQIDRTVDMAVGMMISMNLPPENDASAT